MLGSGEGSRIGPRCMGGNRAIVNEAPTMGLLAAQKRAREVCVHHRLPLLIAEIFECDAWGTDPGVVEQHIEAAERLLSLREQGTHRGRITHVGGHDQSLSCCSASF